MITPSVEQDQIINAPLQPMSIIACAGSGKTFTAVHRLAAIRQTLGAHRGRVALLSFSNIAVDTFRNSYEELTNHPSASVAAGRVEISTLDRFFATNVLRDHAVRTMMAESSPFLVTGNEAFLESFKFHGSYPMTISMMEVGVDEEGICFSYQEFNKTNRLDTAYAEAIIRRLGRLGAYTHSLGRYWCYRTLEEQPSILAALARRYPYILIDEAQDIGTMHQAIIDLLIKAGSVVSLIGDPAQGIYEFAGANGEFINEYAQRDGVSRYDLKTNYRSVPEIVDIANKMSRRDDAANKVDTPHLHSAFFIPYKADELHNLVDAFRTYVSDVGLRVEHSAVLCRSRNLVGKITGATDTQGQGVMKLLARAAILRDREQNYQDAFVLVASSVVSLLSDPPKQLLFRITGPSRDRGDQALRRLIWAFARDANEGLPSAGLAAKTAWHSEMLRRMKDLLDVLQRECGFEHVDNIGRKLSKAKLGSEPLVCDDDLVANGGVGIRVDTVHQAKGESLEAVLYVATKEHVEELLAGTGTEVGRIGYVAVTRARNLMCLAVPDNSLVKLKTRLIDYGFQEFGRSGT